MPEISRFYGIIIRMYFGYHNPPHFHAEYQSLKAEYNIHTLEVLVDKLPQRAHTFSFGMGINTQRRIIKKLE